MLRYIPLVALALVGWATVDARAGVPGYASTIWMEYDPPGDADGNGVVDMDDARMVVRFVMGQMERLPNPGDADATQDGEVTLEDALAIAQSVTGISRVVVAGPVYGLPGKAEVGTRIRIEVFEKFFPFNISGGTVRITSSSTGYDFGDQPLVFEQDGRSLYYHWDTGGLTPASDYEIFVDLAGAGQAPARTGKRQAGATVALGAPVFQPAHLSQALDAFAAAPGFPLEFLRVFPQDPSNAPYLGPLGRGWMHSYDIQLNEFTDGSVAFMGSNGFNRQFQSNANGTYSASPGDYGQLFREPSGAFVLREKDGFVFRFEPIPAAILAGLRIYPAIQRYRLDFMEDPNGNRISAVYNQGRLSEVQHGSSGQSFQIAYNNRGLIASITDHVGRATTFDYDPALPHLVRVTAPGNRVTRYTYSMGQGAATDHRLLSITFPDNTTLTYTYDSQGRLASEERNSGVGRTEYTYAADGSTTIKDALGNATIVRVDAERNPTEVVDPLGQVVRYNYDGNFNPIAVIDALGRTTRMRYDNLGNVIQITDPAGNQFSLTYEPQFNQLASLQDSRGNVTSFFYDSQGNLTQMLYPDGSAEQFTYGANGFLRSKTKRDGQVITYSYDNRGLLLSKGSGSETFTYTYDANGNLTSATNATGTINFGYNQIDRLVSTTYPGGRTFSYDYNEMGQRTRMTDPDSRVLNYTYDAARRLTRITDASGTVVDYQYDTANRRMRKILGNGVYTTYAYDAAGQVLSLVNYDPGGQVISRFDYTYDAAGNRLSKTTTAGTETYTYDALGQLIGVTYPDGTATQFTYDAMGNRINVVETGTLVTYTANELNQYVTVGSTTFGYDANGNLISQTENGQTTTYGYDFEDRLVSVQTPTDAVSYTYNALGLRNGRTDAQGLLRYLWDEAHVVVEENNTNTTVASYVWGEMTDEPIQMTRNNTKYYYAADALNSASNLIDNSGASVEQYRYDAYGEPLNGSLLGNVWFFTGLEYDFKTGLQYNRLRYYSPSLGRFISTDPINLLGGLNLYGYVLNNPSSFVDPFGLVKVKIKLKKESEMLSKQMGRKVEIFITRVTRFSAKKSGDIEIYIDGELFARVTVKNFRRKDPLEIEEFTGEIYPDALKGRSGSGSSSNSSGCCTCPTFIQTNPPVETIALPLSQLGIKEEQLSGKLVIVSDGALVRANIPIFGVAGGEAFKEYRVEYGTGSSPTEWHLIASSTTPQNTLPSDIDWKRLFHGDAHIYGNLGDWNTGLKNWFHLPCNPPEDTADLNGVYTIRLLVEGKGGEIVEDRVTVEVGRILAQALPGIAVSPDGRVIMRFPEQALTHSFRIYTILPLGEVGETSPPVPVGGTPIGPIYRVREPGDRFAKDVTLEFTASEDELQGRAARHIGIARYDVMQQAWLRLPTEHTLAEETATFRTILTELPAPRALYALILDEQGIDRSTPEANEELKPSAHHEALEPQLPGTLVLNTFEEGLDQWKPRDRFVGAVLGRDNTMTPDSSYALKVVNENQGGNFSVTVWDQPFDVRDYPVMSFDYRVGLGVKTDFYLLVNGRWYNLGFTDDPNDFRNRDMNIANLARMENIVADDQWHAVSINLYEHLRTKTRHTRVDAIVMADWNVGGYMKLEFGDNARDATYYIDNFKVSAATPTMSPATLAINTFDTSSTTNLLDGPSDLFSNPGTNYCQAVVVADTTAPKRSKNVDTDNRVLQLSFDAVRNEAYCGYWTALQGTDLEEMHELSFRLHAAEAVPPMLIGLRHALEAVEARVPLAPYVTDLDPDGWRTVTIPLSAFRGYGLPDLSSMDVLFFIFSDEIASGKGAVLLDNLEFHREPTIAEILDFDRHGMEYNLLGGSIRTAAEEAAVIATDYHEDQVRSAEVPEGTARISYGGTIGYDYGGGRFSYAVWETDLMGFDARKYAYLVLKVRGQKGGEYPNIYLDDGTTRRPIRAKEFPALTTEWQEIYLPLEKFAAQGVDLSHLEAMQLTFEWEERSGTLYVAEMRFEEATLAATASKVDEERKNK